MIQTRNPAFARPSAAPLVFSDLDVPRGFGLALLVATLAASLLNTP